jgi:altronate dehydratase
LDAGENGVNQRLLRAYADREGYPLDALLHGVLSLRGPFDADLKRGIEIVQGWLPQVNAMQRTPQPFGELKIALQCGGSDAFSGISGNPLAAWVSKEVIQAGGSAVLAETDELFGAEAYLLQKVRDAATVRQFLEMGAQFKKQAAWHGHSADGNVSGGNLYRGLYNIYLKSLGAAIKRHPDVRLDYVIAYGERLDEPGYYFMDSPGNDLESIAGQVASGCNLIYFVTGNGSVTNFPFVPTIKIVTTTARYALLPEEMDINAGLYLEGVPLPDLGQATIDLSLAVASGQPSAGELAQQAQVQIWRNWPLTDFVEIDPVKARPEPDGKPLALLPPAKALEIDYPAWQTDTGAVSDRVGLILPASLCSGQIAAMAAQRLNEMAVGAAQQVSRFAALVHTEGCGNSTEPEFIDTMLGYLTHPMAATCLILEHGCEKTHNDFWRQRLHEAGLDPEQFGWASVQLDGGIKRTLSAIEAWFRADRASLAKARKVTGGLRHVRVGLMTADNVDEQTAISLAAITKQIAAAGGTLIIPDDDPLVVNDAFVGALQITPGEPPTLAYARQPAQPGFHLMANTGSQWLETLSGLGATGVEILLALVTRRTQPGHPFIPVLQVAAEIDERDPFYADIDLVLHGSPQERQDQLAAGIGAVLSRMVKPKLSQQGNIGFQVTRGRLGVSL